MALAAVPAIDPRSPLRMRTASAAAVTEAVLRPMLGNQPSVAALSTRRRGGDMAERHDEHGRCCVRRGAPDRTWGEATVGATDSLPWAWRGCA